MDEAQVCCQKVGIMKNGSFATIGTPLEICQKYAKGYNLTVKLCENKREIVDNFISSILPMIKYQTQIHQNRNRYQFEASTIEMAKIFEDLKSHSESNFITTWELGSYSLRDAFHTIHSTDVEHDFEHTEDDLADLQYEL